MPEATRNFKVEEFACHHCGKNEVKQELINMLQIIRDRAGIAIHVNSGYRCEYHNKSVGGVKGSQHTLGYAADISCKKGARFLWDVVRALYAQGKLPMLSYCKLYSSWIHVDCGKTRNNIFDGK